MLLLLLLLLDAGILMTVTFHRSDFNADDDAKM